MSATPAQRAWSSRGLGMSAAKRREIDKSPCALPSALYRKMSTAALTLPFPTVADFHAFLVRDGLERYAGNPAAAQKAKEALR